MPRKRPETLPAEQAKPGKEIELTVEIQEAVYEKIRGGARPLIAARAAGIVDDTFYNWLRSGAQQIEPFYSFFVRCAQAEAELEITLIGIIITAAKTQKNWVPAMTFLERWKPEQYGKRPVDSSKSQPVLIQILHEQRKGGEKKSRLVSEIRVGIEANAGHGG